jgi:hypothetical protein
MAVGRSIPALLVDFCRSASALIAIYTYNCKMNTNPLSPIRMPVAIASRRGISGVIAAASAQPVQLTSHGRVVAVVQAPELTEELFRQVRELQLALLDAGADAVASSGEDFDLTQLCQRLGINEKEVRSKAVAHYESIVGGNY